MFLEIGMAHEYTCMQRINRIGKDYLKLYYKVVEFTITVYKRISKCWVSFSSSCNYTYKF